MRFNYDLYRPKKIIQDAWNSNSAYFRSKDVSVTPLTKIGDADEIHKSQFSGRIPALAKKFKPKKRLVLNEILPRRRRIFVRSADSQKRVEVRIRTPLGRFAEQLNTMPANDRATGKLTARVADLGRELNAVIQRNWQARRSALSQLLLAFMVIGAGAGSVHAYINRSHTMHTDAASQSTNQATTQSGTPTTKNDSQEAPPTPPSTPATPAPAAQPASQNPAPAMNTTAGNQPTTSTKPPITINNGIKESTAPAPQNPSSVPPPVPTTPTPPSTPVNPPPDPSTPPADQPEPEPTSPPSDETDAPQTRDENQDTTIRDTNTDIHLTLPTPRNVTTPQEQKPSTQSPAKQ